MSWSYWLVVNDDGSYGCTKKTSIIGSTHDWIKTLILAALFNAFPQRLW